MRHRTCFSVATILAVVCCAVLVAASQPSVARAADSGRVYPPGASR